MKTTLSMIVLAMVLSSGCTSSSVADPADVSTSAKPTTRLYVRTEPSGAKIRLNGKEERARSPQLFDVPAGATSMLVEVELDGHATKRKTVVIEGGRIKRVEFKFDEKPQPAADLSARSIRDRLTNPPQGWKVQAHVAVSPDQMAAIGKKLGGQIANLSNTIFSAHGQQVQVNVIECGTKADAEKIHEAVLAMKGDPAYALRFDNTIVEFVGTFDVAFAKRAARELGLQSRPGGPKLVSFGPVVEQVLEDPKKRVAELLDLETGRRTIFTEFGTDDRQTHRWIREQKVDVVGVVEMGLPGVMLFDCAVYENANISWDKITPQEIVDHRWLNQTEPDPISVLGTEDPSKLPLTCLFETREKTKGVLQLVGFSDDKENVKIRYKLVRQTVTGPAAAPPAPAVWTCSMHPQIKLPQQGKCPICAMDLIRLFPLSAAEQAVRQVVSKFAKAAAEGDKGTVANLLYGESHHLLNQVDDMQEMISAGMTPAEIDQVIVRGNQALAATKLTQLDHRQFPRPVCMVYILTKQGESWVIRDVDVEDKDGLAGEIRRIEAADDRAEPKKVHLPDADTPGARVVLDLASGEMFDVVRERDVPAQFKGLGKGDLFFDRVLGCLRGAQAMWWDGARFVPLPSADRQGDATAYELPELPCRLLITTAEKRPFDVTILAVTDDGGIDLEYGPADPAVIPDDSRTTGP